MDIVGLFSLIQADLVGSGVDIIRALGQQFSQIVGEDYDLVGFDPQ